MPDSVSRRSVAAIEGSMLAPCASSLACLPPAAQRLRSRDAEPAREAALAAVNVRLFAGLRERAGWSQREIEAATVGDVWRALDVGEEPDGLLYAVNKEYAPRDQVLAAGDEVALIPPVSG